LRFELVPFCLIPLPFNCTDLVHYPTVSVLTISFNEFFMDDIYSRLDELLPSVVAVLIWQVQSSPLFYFVSAAVLVWFIFFGIQFLNEIRTLVFLQVATLLN